MIALNEVPLFIREGKCIPVAEVAESVEQIDMSTLTMLGFDGAEYLLYEDDGFTRIMRMKERVER